jgi:3-oxoacyl-[acyl-carrier protein] reductase
MEGWTFWSMQPVFNATTAASTPLKRLASGHDVAAAILSCATRLGFSTGSNIVVDGGRAL